MRTKLFFTLFFTLVFFVKGIAQQKTVTGIVQNESGSPIEGATVLIKGTKTSTVTNVRGIFTLVLPGNANALIVSHVGMKDEEISIGDKTTVNVTLTSITTALADVVVVGYGTVKKTDLTGAVQSVSNAELNKGIPTNVLEALQFFITFNIPP